MRIGIPTESGPNERRVAAVPGSVKVFTSWNLQVVVQAGAGESAGFPDALYEASGARLVDSAAEAHSCDIVLRVGPPSIEDIALMAADSILVSFLDPFVRSDLVAACVEQRITAVAAEAVPRTTLAQAMDALSSQATAAGYSAALLAAAESPKLMPMLVTAAGTVRPARTLVLGVGVAGLQAIATARRLGAVVHAYDIRPETREQVESLGAKFVEAPTQAGDEGGYATEVDEQTAVRQREILAQYVADAHVVITTAQVPGRRAPVLVTAGMLDGMQPGSVVVDMAAASGGNVEGTVADEIVDRDGVRLFGPTDLASRVATDASTMLARNLQELVGRMRSPSDVADAHAFGVHLEDEVIGPCTIVQQGTIVHAQTRELMHPASEEGGA